MRKKDRKYKTKRNKQRDDKPVALYDRLRNSGTAHLFNGATFNAAFCCYVSGVYDLQEIKCALRGLRFSQQCWWRFKSYDAVFIGVQLQYSTDNSPNYMRHILEDSNIQKDICPQEAPVPILSCWTVNIAMYIELYSTNTAAAEI